LRRLLLHCIAPWSRSSSLHTDQLLVVVWTLVMEKHVRTAQYHGYLLRAESWVGSRKGRRSQRKWNSEVLTEPAGLRELRGHAGNPARSAADVRQEEKLETREWSNRRTDAP